jgi:hypothetical protein
MALGDTSLGMVYGSMGYITRDCVWPWWDTLLVMVYGTKGYITMDGIWY